MLFRSYQNDTTSTLQISFGKKIINVPLSDLVLESTYGTTCYLGLFEQSSNSSYILFGDNVLRNAYVVYDLEDNEVHIGQAYYTDDEDIEIVENTVPTGGGQDSTSTKPQSSSETDSSRGSSNGSGSQSSSSAASSSTDSGGKTNAALPVYSVSLNHFFGVVLASIVSII